MCRDVFRLRPLDLSETLSIHDFLRAHNIDPIDVPANTTIVRDHITNRYVVETYARDPRTQRYVLEPDSEGRLVPRIDLISVDARTEFPL
jgi:hypothetical protein